MIGSSPDVMLTSREWYVGVFGEKKTLRKCLGVCWSEDGKFEFKVKPYGAHRLANVGVEDRAFIRIGAEEASDQIDASVLGGERESGFPKPNGEPFGITREPRPRDSVIPRPVFFPA